MIMELTIKMNIPMSWLKMDWLDNQYCLITGIVDDANQCFDVTIKSMNFSGYSAFNLVGGVQKVFVELAEQMLINKFCDQYECKYEETEVYE